MRLWKLAAETLESPLGLVVAGAAVLWATAPIVTKMARPLAVVTVKGVLALSEQIGHTGKSVAQEWRSIVSEAANPPTGMDAALSTAPPAPRPAPRPAPPSPATQKLTLEPSQKPV